MKKQENKFMAAHNAKYKKFIQHLKIQQNFFHGMSKRMIVKVNEYGEDAPLEEEELELRQSL